MFWASGCVRFLALCLLAFWPRLGWAQTVTIFWLASDSEQTLETATRLRGEILALGIDVGAVEPAPSRDFVRRHDEPSGSNTLDAQGRILIDVLATDASLLVEVWRLDDERRPFLVASLLEPLATVNAAEKLAIRAAEALHSRLVEHDWLLPNNKQREQPKSVAVVQPPSDERAPVTSVPNLPPSNVQFGLGAIMLTGTGQEPAFVPRLNVEWVGASWFRWHVTVAGLGSRSESRADLGTAFLSRHYALVGGSYQAQVAFVRPFVGVALGAMLWSVEGRAPAPLQTHSQSGVVGLGELSVGSHFDFMAACYLTLAGHAQLSQPEVSIRVVDELAANIGPTWGASFSVGVRL